MQPPNSAFGFKAAKSIHEPKHHPSLEWNQLPQFIEVLERNAPKSNFIGASPVKMLCLDFLHLSSISGFRWMTQFQEVSNATDYSCGTDEKISQSF